MFVGQQALSTPIVMRIYSTLRSQPDINQHIPLETFPTFMRICHSRMRSDDSKDDDMMNVTAAVVDIVDMRCLGPPLVISNTSGIWVPIDDRYRTFVVALADRLVEIDGAMESESQD